VIDASECRGKSIGETVFLPSAEKLRGKSLLHTITPRLQGLVVPFALDTTGSVAERQAEFLLDIASPEDPTVRFMGAPLSII
jgi:hypothetical protein